MLLLFFRLHNYLRCREENETKCTRDAWEQITPQNIQNKQICSDRNSASQGNETINPFLEDLLNTIKNYPELIVTQYL